MSFPHGRLLIHHNWYYSFSTVAHTAGDYLSRYFSDVEYSTASPTPASCDADVVLYIHDTLDLLTNGSAYRLRGRNATVAWSDTCLICPPDQRPVPLDDVMHVVASELNFCTFRELGVRGFVHRPLCDGSVDRANAKRPRRRTYLAALGYSDWSDRKNFKQLATLVEACSMPVRALTNVEGPWEKIEYASLSEDAKYEFLADALFLLWPSGAEGFGMPPMEAMSVGTPCIYSDVPAHNSFAVGFPLRTAGPPREVSGHHPDGRPLMAVIENINVRDGRRVLDLACNLPADLRYLLEMDCLEKSRRFRSEIVVEQLYRTFVQPYCPSNSVVVPCGEAPDGKS